MKRILHRVCAAIFSVYFLIIPVFAADELIPVGEIIGLELSDGTVTVAAYDDAVTAARDAGVQIGDRLLSIDNRRVTCSADVRRALQASDGTVDLLLHRNGADIRLQLQPAVSPDGPRLGVFLRQGITGIGTITFFDPDTGTFGTLGHGVNDSCGALLPMKQGQAYEAEVVSIQRGKAGSPGLLKGALDGSRQTGILTRNTRQGVFGTAPGRWTGKPIPVCPAEEVRSGDAVIRCAATGTAQEYSVEILKIYPKSRTDGRNLLLRVTDPDLLRATGGIVQGMSGSPIIQDGKLVGAVTHVLVNDPTRGYGIFIENMLDAAG